MTSILLPEGKATPFQVSWFVFSADASCTSSKRGECRPQGSWRRPLASYAPSEFPPCDHVHVRWPHSPAKRSSDEERCSPDQLRAVKRRGQAVPDRSHTSLHPVDYCSQASRHRDRPAALVLTSGASIDARTSRGGSLIRRRLNDRLARLPRCGPMCS